MTYRIDADITYLDGPLAGVLIKDGFSLTTWSWRIARAVADRVDAQRASGNATIAAVTKSEYVISGPARITLERAQEEVERAAALAECFAEMDAAAVRAGVV